MLTLPIKTKWLDMIDSGEKKEEYRDRTPFYFSRFDRFMNKDMVVKFRAGYSARDRHSIYRVHVKIGSGYKKWGADSNSFYYVLEIKELIEKKAKVKKWG